MAPDSEGFSVAIFGVFLPISPVLKGITPKPKTAQKRRLLPTSYKFK